MILRNKAIDRLRVRQRRERTVEQATEFQHFPEADESSAGEAERRDRGSLVRSALTQIPEEQKQAVELAFFGGLTHEQIAARLDTPLGTIKARIRRGLLKLRDCLKEDA
jgi:RNA polymerase sigma-70 factor (ECF subfamily)